MPIYSHSKLEIFEQCKLKFKYRYIDKIIPNIPKSIEAHLGGIIHETLEWLYKNVMKKKIPTINEIIFFYSEKWKENYSSNIPIVNKTLTAKDYFNRGVEFLVNYYTKNHPFKDNTIATEQKIELKLDEAGKKILIGYIDRLVYNLQNNEIEIHDYKISNNMWPREKLETNRQLALYSLAIKESFGKDKNVCLVWHFLAHNMKVCLRKTDEELEKLRKNIIELIDKIEETKYFPPNKSRLCDWCEYKDICKVWK